MRSDSGKRAPKRIGLASLADIACSERSRILTGLTPEQRERMEAAEHARSVYRAWNAVCGGTREGEHVTGLKYLPETNELLVYLDGSSWTQEMTMLREIIRARMEREGSYIDGFVFRTSREDFRAREAGKRVEHAVKKAARAVPHAELSPEEERAIDEGVAAVQDEKLREALKKAISSSAEWKKGQNAKNKA